jgi:peptide/nickel transport system substrate-binding protein
MQVRILGPVEALADDGRVLMSGTGKPVALLALLSLHSNETVPSARLIDDLWGDEAPKTAAKSLQTYVSHLRRVLGDDTIVTRPGGYLLALGSQVLDSRQFERQAALGLAALEGGDAAAAATRLREALALWRGGVLGALASEQWAKADVERLEEARLQALQARIEADLALGRHASVVSELEQLRIEHPYREHLLALLMLALYRCGRQADALEVGRVARRQMAGDLGIEPTPELAAMELRILRHDPSLAGPSRHQPKPTKRSLRAWAWLPGAVALAVVAALGLHAIGSARKPIVAADSLVLVGPDGLAQTQIPVGASPGNVASGGGFLWVSNELDGTVSRVATAASTVDTIPVGPSPQGMAFAYGDMWVAIGGKGTLAGIDPRASKVVRLLRVGNGPVAVASRGAQVWVANSIDGTLATVDPGAGRVVRAVPVGLDPTAVVATPGGLWVALAGSGTVAELDPAGRGVINTVGVGNDPSALAAAGGIIWVANTLDNTVSRITAATGTVTATIPVGGPPTSLAVIDGTVWVALSNGRLARIDERSGRVTSQSEAGAAPASVIGVGQDAWMTTLPAPSTHRGGTLRILMRGDSFSPCGCVDPAIASGPDDTVLDLVYNGLLAYRRVGGPAGGTLVGDLAQAVPRPGDGGRTYVFRLRRGVRFSNGQPVLASDVRASFVRLFLLSARDLLPIYSVIDGASRCVSEAGCDLSHGIVADDRAGTVTFHLTSPESDFLYALALPFAAVVPGTSPRAMAVRPLPGTGPYQISAFASAGRIVLTRNPRFRVFAPAAVPDGYPDRIIATLDRAPMSAQLAAVQHGTADVVTNWRFPPAEVRLLATRFAAQFHADSYGATEYFFLNTTVTPFNNLNARKAVNDAVDRDELARLSGGSGVVQPTCQILPPDFPGYEPYCPYGRQPSAAGTWTGPNLTQARRLIDKSGTKGDRVVVWAPAYESAPAAYVSHVLGQLGYRAALHVVGPDQYYPQIATPRTQIGWVGWIRDYTSAADFIEPLFTCAAMVAPGLQTNNFSRFCSTGLERLIGTARGLQGQDPVAAQEAWAAADRMIVDQAAAVPYANPLAVTLLSRRTGNYQFNPEWGVLLDQLWVR